MTKEELARVYLENIENNNINPTGGISEEGASDLGFRTYEETIDLMNSLKPQVAKVASAAGPIICGDCAEVIPCQHASGSSTVG